uniref:TetR/AcrR family transcriptional regulator n=1 Tax=Nocardia higoensis TaxID=228599 RepID=UPI0035714C07
MIPESLTVGPPSGAATSGERADAARNRKLLLDAAQGLVREHGVDSLTMDELARRAGVGKGTVFRRFGSRSGLLRALLDHAEHKFQHNFMFGPPPLGPGAAPLERLVAFGRARLLDIEVEGELYRAAELGEASGFFRSAPYRLQHRHVVLLLREAGSPGDHDLTAESLLAMLGAPLVMHQLHVLGRSREQVGDNWERFVRRVADAAAQ